MNSFTIPRLCTLCQSVIVRNHTEIIVNSNELESPSMHGGCLLSMAALKKDRKKFFENMRKFDIVFALMISIKYSPPRLFFFVDRRKYILALR